MSDDAPGGGARDLLASARRGDQRSKEMLFKVVRRILLRQATRLVPLDLQSKGTASDLVQESFLVAFRSFERFRGSSAEEWLAWLRAILNHRAAHFCRAYRTVSKRCLERELPFETRTCRNDVEPAAAARDPTPSDEAMRAETRRLVSECVAKLPPAYQHVLELRFWQGLTFIELGHQLGCSEEAARAVCNRAMRKLAQSHPLREARSGLE